MVSYCVILWQKVREGGGLEVGERQVTNKGVEVGQGKGRQGLRPDVRPEQSRVELSMETIVQRRVRDSER